MSKSVILEIAVDTAADAVAAIASGADRLELCSDLDHHGLSPSVDLLREVKQSVHAPVLAMIRLCSGGFVIDDSSWADHLRTAEELLATGADGIVFGCLRADGRVDEPRCRQMVALASGSRETVFHRAIDLTPDPIDAARTLAACGVTRVLTAGMTPEATSRALGLPIDPHSNPSPDRDTFDARLSRIAELASLSAAAGIQLIACGGVRSGNVAELVRRTGVTQVHSAARTGSVPTFTGDEVGAIRSALAKAPG